jgi:hypothetical protein
VVSGCQSLGIVGASESGGNANKPGEGGKGPGKSCLFFLTTVWGFFSEDL